MTADERVKVRIIPWDDRAFVRAFNRAHADVVAEGLTINGPRAAAAAESRLRERGYANARIDVERTVEEALAHGARWTVWRDGRPASHAGAPV